MMLLQDYEGWDTSRVAGLVCGFLFQQHSLKITAICTTHLPIVQFSQFFYNQHIKWFISLGQLITFESKGLDNQITGCFEIV